MFCRWCGKENVKDDALYCPNCGQDVTDYPAPAADLSGDRGFCGGCGAAFKADYLYCASCGLSFETPATAGRTAEAEPVVAPTFSKPTAILGRGEGTWLSAAFGSGAAVAAGIVFSILCATIISIITNDPYSGTSIKLSPLALWVYTHLPALYLGVAADIEGFQVNANAGFNIPFLFLLSIPLLSLWIGSLVSNRNLERDDWVSRTEQGLRMGVIYAGLLFVASLFTGFNMSNVLPLGLMFDELSNMGFGIVLKFKWLSVIISGLIWATVFGVLVSVGRRGVSRLLSHYAGDKWSPTLSGIGRALSVSIISGVALAVAGLIFLAVTESPGAGEMAVVALVWVLALPNILVYGLGVGAGVALKVTNNIPGEEMMMTISVLQQNEFFHWSLLVLCLIVVVSLILGGYRAAQRDNGNVFWLNGVLVAVGYGLIISTLSRLAQFRATVDLGDLSELMYFFGGGPSSISFFAGTGFWPTLFGLIIIGTLAASLGAFLAGNKQKN